MSYDIDIGPRDFNYTYNLAKFFTRYSVNPYSDLEGLTGSQSASRISAALESIVQESTEVLNQYDPPNGWGSWPSALKFLMEVRDACIENPEEIVRTS